MPTTPAEGQSSIQPKPSKATRAKTPSRVRFTPGKEFTPVLKKRVSEYFETTGLSRRDSPKIYLKTFIICSWCALSYWLLVMTKLPLWGTLIAAVSLGFAMAGIGFNVMHDGGHKAFSKSKFVNKTMALSLDVLGGSSYYWYWKHNYLHHSFPNIHGHDDDLNVGPLGRLAPQQDSYWFHRYQQIYMWFLYGLLPAKWQLWDDFYIYYTGKMMDQPIPRPKGRELFFFITGKILFAALAFVIPLMYASVGMVILFYFMVTFVEGLALAITFQMAHCVEEAEFPDKIPGTNKIDNEWCVHQIETTVNFAKNNRFLTWYMGGLNFQIEHHLFPKISHIHYPALSNIVKKTCEEFGIKYQESPSFRHSLYSHYKLLKDLGKPVPVVQVVPASNSQGISTESEVL